MWFSTIGVAGIERVAALVDTERPDVTLIDAPLIASAARDLDLSAPEPVQRPAIMKKWVAILLVSLILGVAAGACVFRVQVRRAIADWTAPAAPP